MKIGIDIGGSHIAVAIVNNDGKIIKKVEQDIKIQKDMAEYILNYIDDVISKIINKDITEIRNCNTRKSKRY